ncbi:FAD-binding protein, partial [Escherichia coli]|uniref:FAD-binding oxidoreductase n=1 Tax=Escherichia coli TaxID=562 RepID=UPI002301202B
WLAPFGRKIGPDPASINACKIGGIVANNASGMCCGTAQNSYHTLAGLRLLLADAGHWRLVEAPPSEEEKLEGYGLVPFGLFRLLPGDGSQPPALPAASEAETPPPAPACR